MAGWAMLDAVAAAPHVVVRYGAAVIHARLLRRRQLLRWLLLLLLLQVLLLEGGQVPLLPGTR
jgi:hypothetical protein